MSGDFDRDEHHNCSPTSDERVRSAARTLRRPRTAAWIADETNVSVETAQKNLEYLVRAGILQTSEQDGRRRYRIDQLLASYREVATLQREHSYEELTATLESMRSQIAAWKEIYDVETPSELKASIADLKGNDKTDQRRKIASEWVRLDDRLSLVEKAVDSYEWATKRDGFSGRDHL